MSRPSTFDESHSDLPRRSHSERIWCDRFRHVGGGDGVVKPHQFTIVSERKYRNNRELVGFE